MSARTMRVAHLVDGVGIGGAERLLTVAADALAPHGVEVSVLSLRAAESSTTVQGLEARGVEIICLPSRRKSSLLDPERLRRVRLALRAGNYDVVQTHLLYANVAGALAGRRAGVPVVATLHQSSRAIGRFERERDLIEAFALRRGAARVIAVGPAVADAYRHRLRNLPLDVVVNPIMKLDPVADDVRDAVRSEILGDEAGPLVISVGRLEPVKGFEELIDAFRAVVHAHPGAVLAIAGRGSMRETLVDHARRAGLEQRVRILGLRNDVPALLAASDLFVMSSRSEGRPFALLEAMAAGLPIVATAVGDIPNMLKSQGLLVRPNDTAELAEAMTTVLSARDHPTDNAPDPNGEGCAEYGQERWAEDMMRIYRAAAARGRSPRRALTVAVLTHGYKPRIGGIESQRAATMPRVVELGANAHVVTRSVPGAPAKEILDGVPVRRFAAVPDRIDARWSGAAMSRVGRPLGSIIWSSKALLQVMRLRPDVIHADEVLSTSRVALLAGRILRTPVIVFAHASGRIGEVERNRRTHSGRRLLNTVRRRSRLVVSVSDEIDDEFGCLGVEAERRLVLSNGVDICEFRPATPDERAAARAHLGLGDEFVAVFTGRLAPEKRLDRALAVWPSVREASPGATLLVVGAGSEEESLRASAPDGVRFIGLTTDVRLYLRAADAFVLTSDREGLPCALLEAQASGLPAVVTNVGAIRRVIEDGANGFVVEPDDDESLQKALRVLACEPQTRRAMGAEARNAATNRFALDDVASALHGIYLAVARDGLGTQERVAASGKWGGRWSN